MYLQGKLNQNAHITLRALEDWQQLNLAVKNLVKELKTFDLPFDKIISQCTVEDIYGCIYGYIFPLLLLSWFFFSHDFFLTAHSQFSSMHVYVYICMLWHMNIYVWVCVCALACLCMCVFACRYVNANRRKACVCVCVFYTLVWVYVVHVYVCVVRRAWGGLSPNERGRER